MASAELAIAKASFAAVLFKPDPASCSRDDIEQFHGLLGAAIDRCSPANVQKCKRWALQHLVRSPARVASLGKYLVALAGSFTADVDKQKDSGGVGKTARPSAKRKRLHILYVLSDIFYHVKFRDHNDAFFGNITPFLPPLFRSAASFSNAPKHIRKLESLVDIWRDRGYFSPELIDKLRAAIAGDAAPAGPDETAPADKGAPSATNKAKEAPFIMPSMHGDPTTPWYDLPAANWLPVIEPNSTRPMNPGMIRPLQLAPGPADKGLIEAVKKLLVDVDRIYARDLRLDDDDGASRLDVDQMGEVVERDEITGEVVGGTTYYGWSRAFCERMQARRKKGLGGGDGPRGRGSSRSSRRSSQSRSRSRGRSSSRSSSARPAFKRRRLSSASRSRSRDMARPGSVSRSGSNTRSSSRRYRRSRSHSRSRSRSGGYRRRGSDSRGASRSPGYSPPPAIPPTLRAGAHPPPPPPGPGTYGSAYDSNAPNPRFAQPPPFPPPGMPPIPPPPPPAQQQQQQQPGAYGAWNVPPPPPPPAQYQGHWPPPPPPPVAGGNPPAAQAWFVNPAASQPWSGGWGQNAPPPPPPPPPPPAGQQGGYQYGRGGSGGYRGQGRGGYGRGRGW
ncbi:RNA polymerase II-binding domain protein [Pleurostoma richardsiae]|uniref:RNA polymerase II-binding domain protein n=1 Tax=Pleurostoma richardsiae TaxID=41990 RepID=A0AA38R9A7_9PEZI|nr:RNA polymerase II-binding domain protein [Pleurostoma richardsiae]